ncbi:MAG TPA: glycosyltransferase [Thermoanaerobaculia bacterium]|nr:glycosyltransferase [Thermoanaerobaculia bacterium]
MRCTFFLAGEDLDALSRIDRDRDWRELQTGERAWILQTWLLLYRAGHPVELSGTAPGDGLVVFHPRQKRLLLAQRSRLRDAVLVGTRADYRQPLIADFEILQNSFYADGRRRFWIPHWPQPGLVPRDPARGERIERIAFKGFAANLHPGFREPEWAGFLAREGIEWIEDALAYAGRNRLDLEWPDFRTVDLVVAVRPNQKTTRHSKPPTKLFNAWLAGVPALLGPESAYRELRRSALDYLEVASVAEAKEAVLRLRRDPGLYRAMVDNGLRRRVEFTPEALVPRWADLLFETIPALAERRPRLTRRLPLPVRAAGRWLARTFTLRPAK